MREGRWGRGDERGEMGKESLGRQFGGRGLGRQWSLETVNDRPLQD